MNCHSHDGYLDNADLNCLSILFYFRRWEVTASDFLYLPLALICCQGDLPPWLFEWVFCNFLSALPFTAMVPPLLPLYKVLLAVTCDQSHHSPADGKTFRHWLSVLGQRFSAKINQRSHYIQILPIAPLVLNAQQCMISIAALLPTHIPRLY